MLFLIGMLTPAVENQANGKTIIALFSTSMIWCLIAVTLCSSSGTLIRLIAVDQLVVRGVFAVALALITACLAYCLVASLSLVLQEKIRWIASWILLFLFCQAVIPLFRLQWKAGRMLATTLITACLLSLLAIGDWLAPGLPLIVFGWCLSAASVVLLQTRSLDTFQYDQEFKSRLRTHLRTKRIPFSIQIRRVN